MLTSNAGGLLHNWTPRNQASLESGDVDLGSTAPALIGGYAVQGGKDGKLRLLNLSHLGGRLGATGGELQTVTAPGGAEVFTAPAVSGKRLFVATNSGLDCYVLSGGRLHLSWHRSQGGTSPVVAGGLLYVYNGSLNVYAPSTGKLLASFNTGRLGALEQSDRDGRPRRRAGRKRERPSDERGARHFSPALTGEALLTSQGLGVRLRRRFGGRPGFAPGARIIPGGRTVAMKSS
jgi:hypothetical protein